MSQTILYRFLTYGFQRSRGLSASAYTGILFTRAKSLLAFFYNFLSWQALVFLSVLYASFMSILFGHSVLAQGGDEQPPNARPKLPPMPTGGDVEASNARALPPVQGAAYDLRPAREFYNGLDIPEPRRRNIDDIQEIKFDDGDEVCKTTSEKVANDSTAAIDSDASMNMISAVHDAVSAIRVNGFYPLANAREIMRKNIEYVFLNRPISASQEQLSTVVPDPQRLKEITANLTFREDLSVLDWVLHFWESFALDICSLFLSGSGPSLFLLAISFGLFVKAALTMHPPGKAAPKCNDILQEAQHSPAVEPSVKKEEALPRKRFSFNPAPATTPIGQSAESSARAVIEASWWSTKAVVAVCGAGIVTFRSVKSFLIAFRSFRRFWSTYQWKPKTKRPPGT